MYIINGIHFNCIGGDKPLKQHEVHRHHKDQVVEELLDQSFSSSRPTALYISPMEFEEPGDLQQSVMIARPSDYDLTSEIMDAVPLTITNFQVF